jgi:hypothetical protein
LDQIEDEFIEFQKRMQEKIEIVRNIFWNKWHCPKNLWFFIEEVVGRL